MDISELIKLAADNKKNVSQILQTLFNYINDIGKNVESIDTNIKKLAEYSKKEITECQKQISKLQEELDILRVWKNESKVTKEIDNG